MNIQLEISSSRGRTVTLIFNLPTAEDFQEPSERDLDLLPMSKECYIQTEYVKPLVSKLVWALTESENKNASEVLHEMFPWLGRKNASQ